MSASAERREPIDIEEFERRLRAPEAAEPSRDPLADLARLVAGQGRPADPFESIFADTARRAPQAPQAPQATSQAAPGHFAPPPGLPDLPDLSTMMRGGFNPGGEVAGRQEPRFDPRFEAAPAPAVEAPHPDEFHPSNEYEDWAEEDSVPPDAVEPAPSRSRSRKPLILAGVVMLAGLGAIGATLAWRGGSTSPQGVKIIKAASGPTKVQPEGQTGSETAQSSTVLDKTSSTPAVKKVISRDEPPMDVAAADKTPRIIPLAGDSAPKPPAPPPPIQTTTPQPSAAPQVFPEPKKVKTVAVRADGTIISSDAKAAPPPPSLAAPTTRNSTPKTDTRAAATPAPPTMPITSPAPNAKPPAPPAPPKQVATAAPTPAPVAAAPKPPAPKPAAKPAPKPVAAQEEAAADDGADNAPKPVASGGAAIQLAAAGSEAEARQAAQRLGEKFSSQLGGRRPSVVKAPDKAVWRVRVSGLSRESAVGACEKIKSAGGQCYVP